MKSIYLIICSILVLVSCKLEEPQNPPSIITKVASDVTLKNATLNGEVTDEGFSATSDRGFVFSDKNPNPSVSDTKIQSGYGKGEFSIVLDKLPVKTKYYYKAYATNTKGTAYGEVQSFTTADYSLSSLNTELPKNVGYTTAVLGGIITNDGGASISERGVCYSLNPNPTITDNKVVSGRGIGSFAVDIINLKDNSKYYARAYAINAKGIAYGNEQTFSTIEFKLPAFINKEPNSIGSTSFLFGTEISDNGGTDIVERGFCYGVNNNPTVNDTKLKSGNGDGSYFSMISGLRENTTYYIRSYAINSKGIGYGSQVIVKTLNQASVSSNLKTGILAYYPLDGNANDASQNGISLITKGEVKLPSQGLDRFGDPGKCAGFNLYGGLITNSSKLNDSKSGFSISLWVKSLVYNSSEGILSRKFIGLNLINDNQEEINIYISRKNYFVNSDFYNNKFPLQSTILFDNNWHHIVLSLDYSNKLVSYFVDGVNQQISQVNISSLGFCNLSIGSSYERINLPNFGNADIKYDRWGWSGYIDDVGFWNRTLSLDEIKYLYQNSYKP
jgi:FlaG/FlaF family flagellin (archaellin)